MWSYGNKRLRWRIIFHVNDRWLYQDDSHQFLKKKSEVFECFKIYKELVENEIDLQIKFLRLDNGGEFTSKLFQQYCDENGIKRQFSIAWIPQQMELLKERIEPYRKWVEQCWRTQNWMKISRLKQLILQSSLSIEVFSEIIAIRPHMNYGKKNLLM